MAVMTDVREAAQGLIEYAIHRSMIGQDDRIWAYNTILECIGATGPALDMTWALQVEKLSLLHPDTLPDFDLEGTLAALSEAAVANGAAEDTASGRDRIAMRIMGALMPRPSVVNEEFNGRIGVNEPRAATDWFYGLCCDAGYVRRAAIARNIKWRTPTNWGDLEITINLSKPEKDPRAIAAAKLAGAHVFITRLPEGYNTMLSGNGAQLSQGQRQLDSDARAAVADPPGTKGDGFADIVVIATFSRMDGKRKIGEIRIMKQCFKFRQRDCRFRTGQIKPGNTDILIGNSQLGSLLILSRASGYEHTQKNADPDLKVCLLCHVYAVEDGSDRLLLCQSKSGVVLRCKTQFRIKKALIFQLLNNVKSSERQRFFCLQQTGWKIEATQIFRKALTGGRDSDGISHFGICHSETVFKRQ